MPQTTIAQAAAREANTPAMELRTKLSELESHVGKINRTDRDTLLTIPARFQDAADLLHALEAQEANIASEKVRFNILDHQFQRAKRDYIKQVGGMNVYVTQVRDIAQPKKNWWWHLDTLVADENRHRRTMLLKNIGIAAAVFIILVVLYQLFLAPDEVTRETVRLESAAERALMEGDYAAALPRLDEALQVNPAETRLWIFRGVVHELQGNTTQADADYSYAQAQEDDEESFLVQRSQIYMTAAQPERALMDAEKAIVVNPESALAYYQIGTANNVLQQTLEAIAAFEKCAELAHQQDMTELEGLARVQIAYIYGGQ